MRDITSELSDFLGTFTSEAKAGDKGERDMLAIACALESAAKAIRADRDSMTTEIEWHCCNCGKRWGVKVTVARERDLCWGPDVCPVCYNAAQTDRALSVGEHCMVPLPDGREVEAWVSKMDGDSLLVKWVEDPAGENERTVSRTVHASEVVHVKRRSGWTDSFFYYPEEG